MEAMLGISLNSYLYFKLAMILFLSYYLLCFLFNKIEEEDRTGSSWKREELGTGHRGERWPNNVCTYE
jgi:hypothetical protein